MWTQRDQLQAYQFLRRRLVSALQVGDANHPISPSRRVIGGTALGLVAALIITAGFAIYTVLRPGASQDWKKPGKVVIEKETGAAYVLDKEGRLHPVVNYTSARLLAGGDGTATVTVSAKSLASVARGTPMGIDGAPTSLPARNRLLGGPWAVCTETLLSRPSSEGPATTATVGVVPSGVLLGQLSALIVADDDGVRYAIITGRRLRIRDAAASAALGYDSASSVRVSTSWANSVPAGPDLALITVPGAGQNGPLLGGKPTRIGQVLVKPGLSGSEQYYLVESSGLTAISQTEAALILGNPANRPAYGQSAPKPVEVSAAELSAAGSIKPAPADNGFPTVLPEPVSIKDRQFAICAVTDSYPRMRIWIAPEVPLPVGGKRITVADRSNANVADQAFVPPGQAALVREQQGDSAVGVGTVYLVTDQGIRFPINGTDALTALGYGAVRPIPVASALLTLFPVGPVLDIADAGRPSPTQPKPIGPSP